MATLAADLLPIIRHEEIPAPMFDFIAPTRSFLLNCYRQAVAANPAYFTETTYADDDTEEPLSALGFVDTPATQPPIDREALRFLVETVGLSKRDIRLAGWASCPAPDHGRVLIAPATNEGKIIAVRAIRVLSSGDDLTDLQPDSDAALDPSERLVESNPEATLEVDDMPVPFRRGLFDMPVTWVSHDPVDALLLRSLGLNATSFADPFRTLGSREGLWQLQDLGALSRRSSPKGTLVIIDPDRRRTVEQDALLTGQFQEVWAAGEDFTGRQLWGTIRASRRSEFFPKDPQGTLLGWVKLHDETLLQVSPVMLPPRWDGNAFEGQRTPFAFVSASEMAGRAGRSASG